jgi:hypothetical protein
MNITPVEHIPTAIDLAVNMRAHLLQLRTTFTKPFLGIIYEHRSLLRPTNALSQPAANFNLATVRGHVLPSFQPHLNYFNNTKVKIPKEELCNIANHICNKFKYVYVTVLQVWRKVLPLFFRNVRNET